MAVVGYGIGAKKNHYTGKETKQGCDWQRRKPQWRLNGATVK